MKIAVMGASGLLGSAVCRDTRPWLSFVGLFKSGMEKPKDDFQTTSLPLDQLTR